MNSLLGKVGQSALLGGTGFGVGTLDSMGRQYVRSGTIDYQLALMDGALMGGVAGGGYLLSQFGPVNKLFGKLADTPFIQKLQQLDQKITLFFNNKEWRGYFNILKNNVGDVGIATDDVARIIGGDDNPSVVYGTNDIAGYQYNMIENPGPLAEMPNQPAKNFYGCRYNMEVLQEDTIMYRAGNADNPYGRWFTSEPPTSIAKARIDTAVKTHWIDPKTGVCEATSYLDTVYAIKVPKGTTVYTGPVGPQGGPYVGGYNIIQTYIDAPWTFEVIRIAPLQ